MIKYQALLELLRLNKGNERSIKAKKNIFGSLLIRGLNIGIGLVIVPLTINYINPKQYGIWITLTSVVGWFGFFDIGLGNGLRNKYAEAIALNDQNLAKTYVSTTYAVLSMIIGAVLIFFYLINPYLDWTKILNTGQNPIFKQELNLLVIIVFTFFCLRFVLKLIATILIADQRPAKASLFDFISNVGVLVLILILIETSKGSLLLLGITISSLPVFVLIIASLILFHGKYKIHRPSIRYIQLSKAKGLFTLGFKFFIIQISAVLLYQTNNIIISHLFGPEDVTPYTIAFKYFSIIMMLFTIVISPFWSAITEAWIKMDLNWIKRIMHKLIYFWFGLFMLGIIMLFFSEYIYLLWIGPDISIPFVMSALICAWVLLNAWNGIFSHFLNGVGIIQIQLYVGIAISLLNIPSAIFLANLIGIEGIFTANLIFALIQSFIVYYQYKKIISSTAVGIWKR